MLSSGMPSSMMSDEDNLSGRQMEDSIPSHLATARQLSMPALFLHPTGCGTLTGIFQKGEFGAGRCAQSCGRRCTTLSLLSC